MANYDVIIIGSGPAGLTAAYHLARLGYRVSVYESGGEIGGLLRTGIPEFRLPEDIVDKEIDRILALGVNVVTNHRIDRQALFNLARDYDGVLVATGLQEQVGLRLGLDGTAAVVQGIEFLDHVYRDEVRVDGEDVIVIGGGNTAMDAARSALRLGAASVRVVYRRTRDEMPAISEEIDEALAARCERRIHLEAAYPAVAAAARLIVFSEVGTSLGDDIIQLTEE